MTIRPRTIICDIDGTLIRHTGDICKQHRPPCIILSGVREKIKQWDMEGCHIILMTGRRESTRKDTEEQLSKEGIVYDDLIMNVGGGTRVLINDRKPDKKDDTAIAICVDRNVGLKNTRI